MRRMLLLAKQQRKRDNKELVERKNKLIKFSTSIDFCSKKIFEATETKGFKVKKVFRLLCISY